VQVLLERAMRPDHPRKYGASFRMVARAFATGDVARAGGRAKDADSAGTAKPPRTTIPGIAQKGGAQMRPIGLIEATAPVFCSTVEQTPTVERYLLALARSCIEAAANPRVRGLLFALLLRAPRTIAQLGRERKRVAA
jgi:hypothetical protein